MSNLEKELRTKLEAIDFEIDSIKIKIKELIKVEGGELITRKKHTSLYNKLETLIKDRRLTNHKLEDIKYFNHE